MSLVTWKKELFVLGLLYCGCLTLSGVVMRSSIKRLLKCFCEDGYLRDSAKYIRVGVEVKVDILLDRILNAMGNGEIITPASFRVSFLTNWLDAMVMLIAHHPMHAEKLLTLERGIMDVADTLPLADQKLIYNIWKDVFKRLGMDQSNALKWWAQKVQDAASRMARLLIQLNCRLIHLHHCTWRRKKL
jgi:hypothetical protein